MPDRAATRSWPPVPAAVNSGPGVNGDKIFYKLISPRTSPDDWNPAGQTIDFVKLRQGSGKERQGKARDGER